MMSFCDAAAKSIVGMFCSFYHDSLTHSGTIAAAKVSSYHKAKPEYFIRTPGDIIRDTRWVVRIDLVVLPVGPRILIDLGKQTSDRRCNLLRTR